MARAQDAPRTAEPCFEPKGCTTDILMRAMGDKVWVFPQRGAQPRFLIGSLSDMFYGSVVARRVGERWHMTMLADGSAVEAVLRGPDGALHVISLWSVEGPGDLTYHRLDREGHVQAEVGLGKPGAPPSAGPLDYATFHRLWMAADGRGVLELRWVNSMVDEEDIALRRTASDFRLRTRDGGRHWTAPVPARRVIVPGTARLLRDLPATQRSVLTQLISR